MVNANIHTLEDVQTQAEALAVKDGRFVAVGHLREVEPFIGDGTTVFDAGGRTILPGFIDAHLHPRPVFPEDSPLAGVDCGPARASTMELLLRSLREKALKTPEGMHVRGRGYEDTKLGRHPTRTDLDKASTEHPIIITHSSSHLCVANSLALEISGIDAATKDPKGGQIDRDANGVPTGILRESAQSLIKIRGKGISPVMSDQERTQGLLACFDEYLSKGITCIAIAGASKDDLAAYTRANQANPTIRMYVMLRESAIEDVVAQIDRDGRDQEWIRVGGIKLFHGNSLSGRTCWLYESYAGRPDYYGIPPARSQESLNTLVSRVHNAGLQACIHANGDREIDMVLNALEQALATRPRQDHRHRIEHASVVNTAILERVKRMGVVLAPHSYIWEHGDKMEEYGEHRWGMMHPNGSAVRMGVPACGNSDSPVSAADPMLRIQDLATRTSAEGKVYGPEQMIDVPQAVRLWTRGSAFACFWEKDIGSIAVGKRADFVVLDRDPLKTPKNELRSVRVLRTYVGGKALWSAQPASAQPAQERRDD